jgi:hypothetical protein
MQRAKQAGMLAEDLDIPSAARAVVALIDGLAIQVLRSGKPPSTQLQRQILDTFISTWLRPTARR